MEESLKSFAEELSIVEYDIKEVSAEIEKLYPEILLIVQKNEEFFDKKYFLFNRPISVLNHEVVWNHLPMCIYTSFTTGDISEKVASLIELAKNYITANPSDKTDEISKILNDDNSQSSIKEFLDYCTNTRIAKVLNDILTNMDVSEYEYLLKAPEKFIEIARNPEHPLVQKFIHKFQTLLKERVQRGEITQNQLTQDVEGIKAKLVGLFGSALGDALGGNKSDVSSGVLLSNSPEARRQRMLARLQKKQREKN